MVQEGRNFSSSLIANERKRHTTYLETMTEYFENYGQI